MQRIADLADCLRILKLRAIACRTLIHHRYLLASWTRIRFIQFKPLLPFRFIVIYIREGTSASHQPYHLRPSRLTCQAQMYVVTFLQTHEIVSNMWLRYYKPSMPIKRRPPVVFSKHSFQVLVRPGYCHGYGCA